MSWGNGKRLKIYWKDYRGSIGKILQNDVPSRASANLLPCWVEGLLGATYARQGKTEKALLQIEKLEELRKTIPENPMRMRRGAVPYFQARIFALLNEKEQAVAMLKKAIEEGKGFEYESFIFDLDLANLKGYPTYEELIRPKEGLEVPN